jgi:hypothetical protein
MRVFWIVGVAEGDAESDGSGDAVSDGSGEAESDGAGDVVSDGATEGVSVSDGSAWGATEVVGAVVASAVFVALGFEVVGAVVASAVFVALGFEVVGAVVASAVFVALGFEDVGAVVASAVFVAFGFATSSVFFASGDFVTSGSDVLVTDATGVGDGVSAAAVDTPKGTTRANVATEATTAPRKRAFLGANMLPPFVQMIGLLTTLESLSQPDQVSPLPKQQTIPV